MKAIWDVHYVTPGLGGLGRLRTLCDASIVSLKEAGELDSADVMAYMALLDDQGRLRGEQDATCNKCIDMRMQLMSGKG